MFGIDIEGCARCRGKRRLIEEPQVIARILAHPEKKAADHCPGRLRNQRGEVA